MTSENPGRSTQESLPTRCDITVVVVSYNVNTYLRRCLDALFQNAGPVAFEAIVVDNASSDESVAMVADVFPQVRLIRNPENRYFSKANNQGIQLAKGDYVLLLNPDAEIQPGALDAMVKCMREHPTIGIVGPRLLNADGTYQRSCYRHYSLVWGVSEILLFNGLFPNHPLYRRHFYLNENLPEGGGRAVDVVTAACMMVRSSLLKALGGMDENYILYGEEIDLCRRALALGFKTFYLPDARVVHHIGGATALLPKREIHEWGARSHLYFVKKFYPRWIYYAFRSMSYFALHFYFFVKSHRHPTS